MTVFVSAASCEKDVSKMKFIKFKLNSNLKEVCMFSILFINLNGSSRISVPQNQLTKDILNHNLKRIVNLCT